MKINEIIFLNNGNTFVSDERGEQISEWQRSWLRSYIDWLSINGIDIDGLKMIMPNGIKFTIFKTKDGYNWGVKE